MVSLSDESRRSRGYFFNEDSGSSIQSRDTEELIIDPDAFHSQLDSRPRKIRTPFVIVLHMIIVITTWACVFVLPAVCKDNGKCGIDPFSLLVYISGGTWFLELLCDFFYRHQHYIIRLHGYLDFYRKTRNIHQIPLMIGSAVNSLLLVITQVLHDKCDKTCSSLEPVDYLKIILSLRCFLQLVLLFLYMYRTVKFNRSEAFPDIYQDEMMTSFIQSQSNSSDIGFRDESYLDQILERQADVIRYLKQHNAQLGKRILTLTAENKTPKPKG
ncbi:hypothetical protein CHS0354_031150 [Potamilus streckersoni]|uniref:Transmembrane protein 192 n=1 Tax=Potamilus streckersoni TaxID=2493646 RepID=A0AAE0TKI5_9BIVA|nr:hypothetical protein CHS0354_031150 [Potamilus streckersoni]